MITTISLSKPETTCAEEIHQERPLAASEVPTLRKTRPTSRAGALLVLVATAAIAMGVLFCNLRRESSILRSDYLRMQERLTTLIESQSRTIETAFDEAKGSVFHVYSHDAEGHRTAIGTAWAIEAGTLATAGHVAEAINESLKAGTSVAVRPLVGGGNELAVNEALAHPGYDFWSPLAARTFPRFGADDIEEVFLVPPCDVGLLRVSGDVGKSLVLASDDELRGLRNGTPVGIVGYPTENLPGVPFAPITSKGEILAVSDYFYQTSAYEDAYQIMHSGVSAGGASGSPLLNAAGHVVGIHSAGSVVMTTNGFAGSVSRVPTGFLFSQRIDLVREMLSGSADRLQEERNAVWLERFAQLTITPQAAMDHQLKENGTLQFGAADFAVATIDEGSEKLAKGLGNGIALTLQLDSPGVYAIVASAADWSDVDIVVYGENEELYLLDTSDNEVGSALIEVLEGQTFYVEIFARTLTKEPPTHYRVVRYEIAVESEREPGCGCETGSEPEDSEVESWTAESF